MRVAVAMHMPYLRGIVLWYVSFGWSTGASDPEDDIKRVFKETWIDIGAASPEQVVQQNNINIIKNNENNNNNNNHYNNNNYYVNSSNT